ncbi:MAG: calcium-binding protein, partial [Pseudomonadota bacterium]
MNRDVFLSLLALDAYNRGYNQSVLLKTGDDTNGQNEVGREIGNATIIVQDISPEAKGVDFYAIAYDWNGETIISYRGTDDTSLLADPNYGYGLAVGLFDPQTSPQAYLAREFYKTVADADQDNNPFTSNVALTGHSLGGGLAGHVAKLYGKKGMLFDNMPFEFATDNAYQAALTFSFVSDDLYGTASPQAPSDADIDAIAVDNEFLSVLRTAPPEQDLSVDELNSHNPDLSIFELHSMSLLVALLWARESGVPTDWHPAAKHMWNAWFDPAVAASIPEAANRTVDDENPGQVASTLSTAIAYSVIDEGERPFGDTAIHAFFNDGQDLGGALSAGANVSSTLLDAADILGSAILQFAGKLALGDVVGGASASVTEGILDLSNDGSVLSVDFSSTLWNTGAAHTSVIGRERLLNDALATFENGSSASDLTTGINWIYPFGGADNIDRVQFATTNDAQTLTLPDRAGFNTSSSIFVSGDGNDTLTGSDDNEVIVGGQGNDTIFGGDGNDLIAGGRGDDTLSGGGGRDFIAGGDGFDTLDLGLDLFGSTSPANISIEAIKPASADERTAIEITSNGDVDRIIDIEQITLSDKSDRVALLGDVGDHNGGGLRIDMGLALEALNQDVVDASAATTGVYFDVGSGRTLGLDTTTDRGSWFSGAGWLPTLLGSAFSSTDLEITGSEKVLGTDYSDALIASSTSETDLYGGDGNDLLVGRGPVANLWGEGGADVFQIGSNTVIKDAEKTGDSVWMGLPIFGGTKQWWMEGNKAYWSPFSTIQTAFPVIGSQILSTAAFFVDVATMKFASFQSNEDGSLGINIGYGLGGVATIEDYQLDFDTGAASGGVVVFETGRADGEARSGFDEPSKDNFTQFINLALKAGFGVGFTGWDPIVLDLDGDGYELTTQRNSGVHFEFDGDGFAEKTGWVRPDDGFLVLDANANGIVDDSSEFFGDETQGGFVELATHDLNADDVIDSSDAVFTDLSVWRDLNSDGVTDVGELLSLTDLGITSISLAAVAPAEAIDIGGNTIAFESTFTLNDGTVRNAGDVILDISHIDTRYITDTVVSAGAAALPELRGFGNVADLRVAMSEDAALLAQVQAFDQLATNDLSVLKQSAEDVLYAWAGVDTVAADPIGGNGFDARKLAFLEAFSGQEIAPRDPVTGAVSTAGLTELENSWADTLENLTLRLVIQSSALPAFDDMTYREDIDTVVMGGADTLKLAYEAILGGLSTDPATALAEWEAWGELLRAVQDGSRRFDNNIVRSDFAAAQLQAAILSTGTSLDLATLAPALGIGNLTIGTDAAETLVQNGGGTIFSGLGDGDIARGRSGQDVYLIESGFGALTIDDEEAKKSGDRIRFVDLNRADVSAARVGADLVLTVDATGDTVTVLGQFADVVPLSSDVIISNNRGVEEIQFADGTVMELPDIAIAVGEGTAGDDVMQGSMHTDVFQGREGNDLLMGGDDADLYVFDAGDGADTIREQQTNPLLMAADMVIFGDDIAPEDLVLSRGSDLNDLLITIGANGDSITIDNQFAYSSLGYNDKFSPNSRIEVFSFRHYGDVYTNKDIQQQLIAAETTDGDDVTRGFGDDDVFGLSAGNDTFIGLDGNDTYMFGRGFGNDTIDESALYIDVNVGLGGLSLEHGADTVVFAPDIELDDVTFSRDSSAPHLLVTLDTGETLTVRNQFAGFQTGVLGAQWLDRVEWFEFGDGTRLSWQDVLLDTTTGGDGDDSLWGDLYQDTLTGGLGNDYLSGGGYADTYIFNLGDGQDVLDDNNEFILGSGFVSVDTTPDILRLGAGITSSDVVVGRDGHDLTLTIGSGGDVVTLRDQNDYFHTGVFGPISYSRIERVEFDDGEVWSWQQLNQFAIEAQTTAGDDTISGFALEDRFEASAGNDVMRGGDSADTYVFGIGSGQDRIEETINNANFDDHDVVEFEAGIARADLGLERVNDDLIISIAGASDTLTIAGQFENYVGFTNNDIETFRFDDGSVLTKAEIMAEMTMGTSSDDTITGFYINDTIIGGAGNDSLYGHDGSDTYIFNLGDGQDTIYETVEYANISDNDRIVFGVGIAPEDITLSRSGNALTLSIDGTSDSITVNGQFAFASWFSWHDVEFFEFADSTVWTKRDVSNFLMGGTTGDDVIVGTFENDEIDGLEGNDILRGGDGADLYHFGIGYGQDRIEETVTNANLSDSDQIILGDGLVASDLSFTRNGDDLVIGINGHPDTLTIAGQFDNYVGATNRDIERLQFSDGSAITKEEIQALLTVGSAADDTVLGFHTSDTIIGGAGNDSLYGYDGSDTYIFNLGDGQDTIYESVEFANISDNDRIVFGVGIAPEDITLSRSGNALTLSVDGTSDSITVNGQFAFASWFSWHDVEFFEFADGTVWTKADVSGFLTGGTAGDDTILGTFQNDELDGGAGNDILRGGDGADIYYFDIGYGQDRIEETITNANLSDYDQVVFGDGIAASDLTFARDGDNLTIGITGYSDTFTIAGQFDNYIGYTNRDIERLQFSDGSVMTKEEIQAVLTIGTAADETVLGFHTSDRIDGGAGNDILHGLDGADTYVFGRGSGNDIIRESVQYVQISDADRVEFAADLTPQDIVWSRTGQSLIIGIADTADTLTIEGGLDNEGSTGYTWRDVEYFDFADGTTLTKSDVMDILTSPTAGDDVIAGFWLNDTLSGEAGNDQISGQDGNDSLTGGLGDDDLRGGSGSDSYFYSRGDGDDVITEYQEQGGGDRFVFADVNSNEVTTARLGADTILTVQESAGGANDGGQITLVDTLAARYEGGVESIEFADGEVWTQYTLRTNYLASLSTPGDDTITGFYHGDTIEAGLGDDYIFGGEGNDTYIYNRGDGNDEIREDNNDSSGD